MTSQEDLQSFMFQLMTPEQLEALAKKKRDLQLQQQPPSTSAPNFSDGDNSIPDDDATILGNDERQKNSEDSQELPTLPNLSRDEPLSYKWIDEVFFPKKTKFEFIFNPLCFDFEPIIGKTLHNLCMVGKMATFASFNDILNEAFRAIVKELCKVYRTNKYPENVRDMHQYERHQLCHYFMFKYPELKKTYDGFASEAKKGNDIGSSTTCNTFSFNFETFLFDKLMSKMYRSNYIKIQDRDNRAKPREPRSKKRSDFIKVHNQVERRRKNNAKE